MNNQIETTSSEDDVPHIDPWLIQNARYGLENPRSYDCISLQDLYGIEEQVYCQLIDQVFFSVSGEDITIIPVEEGKVSIGGKELTFDKVGADAEAMPRYALEVDGITVGGLKGMFWVDAQKRLQNPDGSHSMIVYKQM